MKLTELARIVPLEIVRNGEFSTLGFLSTPRSGMLTFAESAKVFKTLWSAPRPVSVITARALSDKVPQDLPLAISPEPRLAFLEAHNHLAQYTSFYGEPRPTYIDRSARVDGTASIAAENVHIGPDTVIGPQVTISGRCMIGANVVIHPGCVLGSDGFQASHFGDDLRDMAHAGGIDIHDHAILLANSVIAASLFHDRTVIGRCCRIGNLAFVSHNVHLGERCFVGHGAVINGNVLAGNDVWIGPGSTISDCLAIGDRASVTLGSVVINDVDVDQHVTGNIAMEHRRYLRHMARLERSKNAHTETP